MKIEIEFETDNASFQNGEETVMTMLDQVSQKVERGFTEGNLKDINGNTVGSFKGVEVYVAYGMDDFDEED